MLISRKHTPSLLIILLMTWLVNSTSPATFAQNNDNQPNNPQPENNQPASIPMIKIQPPPEIKIPDFQTDTDALKKAQSIFNQSVSAYQAAKAIRDETEVKSISTYAGRADEQSFKVPMLLTQDAMWIKLNKGKFTVIDNTIYGEHQDHPKRFYAQDFEGDITTDLFVDILYLIPFVNIPMTYSDDPLAELFLATINPTIAGYRQITEPKTNRKLDEILIKSADDGADINLRFNPQTHLITRFQTTLRDPNMNEMDGTEIIVTFHPEILTEIPYDEFIVKTDNRREVEEITSLYAPDNIDDLAGQPAPPFNLPDITGQTVNSDTLIGNIVVLGFWKIEHEGLLPILPALNDLATWRDTEGKPVKIYAVNAGDDLDILRTNWNEQNFRFNLLIDQDMSVTRDTYKLGLFPTIIIISTNGEIYAVDDDFQVNDNISEILKKQVIAALKKGL